MPPIQLSRELLRVSHLVTILPCQDAPVPDGVLCIVMRRVIVSQLSRRLCSYEPELGLGCDKPVLIVKVHDLGGQFKRCLCVQLAAVDLLLCVEDEHHPLV